MEKYSSFMDKWEILKYWIKIHGSKYPLSNEQIEKFLSKKELRELRKYPSETVKRAISKNNRLSLVLKEIKLTSRSAEREKEAAAHEERIRSNMLRNRKKNEVPARRKVVKLSNEEKTFLAKQRNNDKKYQFLCKKCHRDFVSTSKPWPSCMQCNESRNVY